MKLLDDYAIPSAHPGSETHHQGIAQMEKTLAEMLRMAGPKDTVVVRGNEPGEYHTGSASPEGG
ncbi:hypothetical protein [uncultured Corynebacterium sp.]|uniref:hypothetical protein n=1 Tax=uncultured Corynebacterium sp. TaxID=159447 RepID=UPI0025F56321|nr:hypothetical protein [uncultured Corynebacterium sp.]